MKEFIVDDILPGDFVKLIKPDFTKTYGQGNLPEGLRISVDNKTYYIPWETIMKISETCDPLNQVADINNGHYPLLHINFYINHKELFEIIKQERISEDE